MMSGRVVQTPAHQVLEKCDICQTCHRTYMGKDATSSQIILNVHFCKISVVISYLIYIPLDQVRPSLVIRKKASLQGSSGLLLILGQRAVFHAHAAHQKSVKVAHDLSSSSWTQPKKPIQTQIKLVIFSENIINIIVSQSKNTKTKRKNIPLYLVILSYGIRNWCRLSYPLETKSY